MNQQADDEKPDKKYNLDFLALILSEGGVLISAIISLTQIYTTNLQYEQELNI